jgi:undecaprenyldiphospho-muramoylpentapeptide beta-N-acetylglucosaminyltransferase
MSRRRGRGVVIAGGGTAGHVLPGLSIARALVARGHRPGDIRFVGSRRGQEATLVPAAGFEVLLLPGRGIQRRLGLAPVLAALGIAAAVVRALFELARRRPGVVVTLGGYASVPAAVAAAVLRVPIVITEQNARAGAANRLVGRVARAAAVAFDDVDLPRTHLCGIPVREAILAVAADRDRAAARAALDLPVDRTVIAVFSGSLGSRTVNDAVSDLAGRWKDRSDVAIHHVVGRRDAPQHLGRDLDGPGLLYRVVEYEERMPQLLAAADVAVCRAGGSTIAELGVVGVPAVLVPLPIATGDHQRHNAKGLVDAGAAVLVLDRDLTVDRLESELAALIGDPARLRGMAEAARSTGHPDAASCIADLVDSVAEGREP